VELFYRHSHSDFAIGNRMNGAGGPTPLRADTGRCNCKCERIEKQKATAIHNMARTYVLATS